MDKFVVTGGKKLSGSVTISGAKNAAVAIIPAIVLCEETCIIENIPNISDCNLLLEMLIRMGAHVKRLKDGSVEINTKDMSIAHVPSELARKMRASYYMLGSLLGRFGHAQVDMPGGCNLGTRSIDQHIKGFEALGAIINVEHGVIHAKANALIGTNVYFDVVTVGATINIMLAACRANGLTVIENAAKEPHIVDVANLLNSMGADIKGAGTDVIKIRGVEKLHGVTYSIIPDQIEAGTYMVAAAITGGEVLVKNVIPKHLESISAKLIETGAQVIEYDEAVLVKGCEIIKKCNVKTMAYPGYPTDMQPQMVALLTQAVGTSIVTENIFDNRFKYAEELKRMGASIVVESNTAVIEGPKKLTGAVVHSCDLRAGAALVLAALCAKGTSEIEDIYHIERGYENFINKFNALGADIRKESDGVSEEEKIG